MSAHNKIIAFLDVCGGIAGASMVLGGLLFVVSEPGSIHRLFQVMAGFVLLASGLVLMFVRQLR
jgi:hypothetical protein